MAEKKDSLRDLLFDVHDGYGAASTGPTNIDGNGAMKTESSFHKLSSAYSTAGMGDLSLLNVITMSPDMSAAASSSFSPHQFPAPITPPQAKGQGLISSPTYSMSGHHPLTYSSVGLCVSSHQSSVNPYSSMPASEPTMSVNVQYRPHRPASTPTNDCNLQNQNNVMDLKTLVQNNPQSVFQTNNPSLTSPKSLLRLHSMPSNLPAVTKKLSTSLHFSSLSSQKFMYKLSKIPAFDSSHDMQCHNPVLISSSVSGSMTPLATQDLNAVYSTAPMMSSHCADLSPVASSVLLPGVAVYQGLCQASVSPCFTGTCQNESLTSKSLSTSSTTRHTSVNSCNSPLVSDIGSEDTHCSAPQQSFAQSYASLTPWTSKLTAPGFVPLPVPAADAMPIPLENTESGTMLSVPPTDLEMPSRTLHSRTLPIYSRLQPGMTPPDTCTKQKNGVVRGPSQIQKINAKSLPNKEHRFKRTADALQKSGLWEVAMKTGSLIKRNQEIQRELEQFRSDALAFLKSVIKNPQDRDTIKNVLNNALTTNGGPHNTTSVMTVVVSAAAAAAAASVKLDSCGSTDGSISGSGSVVDSLLNSSNVSEASSDTNFLHPDCSVTPIRMEMN
ncbi:unnamed protein product [Lymnaea stagnalis]|uniref:BHLH domain-containing protein n=1 Tax=Lymnaea stagnalis TaxID=6523 RepID=A0AAV2ICN6_LYMST